MTALLLLAVTAILVLGIVIWPLVRGASAPQDRALYDQAVHHDQLDELKRDVDRGVLSEADAAAAAREITRQMPELPDDGGRPPASSSYLGFAGGLAVLCVAVAMVIYRGTGTPGLPDQPIIAREAQQLGVPVAELENIISLTQRLEEQLAQDPNNAQGWALLAQTYRQMNRGEQAIRAFRRAADLNRGDSQLLADYGEVAIAMAGGVVSEEAFAAFAASFAAAPRNPRARFFLGLAQAQSGQSEAALAIWKHLLEESQPDAPWMGMLTNQIAAVSEESGLELAAIEARPPQLPGTGIPQDPAAQDEMIRSMVSRLAARLVEEPDNLDGWLQLGRSYAVLEDFEGAWDAFDMAADLDPENAPLLWSSVANLFPAESDQRLQALARASAAPEGDSPN